MIFLTKLKDQDKSMQVFVSALSYTEAESYSQQIQKVICRDFSELESITKTSFKEILEMNLLSTDQETNKIHFKAKVGYMVESNSGKMRLQKVPIIVQASDYADAYERLTEYVGEFMADSRILSLEETEVLDYYDRESVLEMEVDKLATNLLKEGMTLTVNDSNPFI